MNLLENIKTLLLFLKNRNVYYKMNHYNYEFVRGSLTFNDGGLAMCNNADFLKNPGFHAAYIQRGKPLFRGKEAENPILFILPAGFVIVVGHDDALLPDAIPKIRAIIKQTNRF